MQFDIESFYPSITPELLNRAIDWASDLVKITPQQRKIIHETKQSFLYTGSAPWVKKGNVNFDIAMGAYDGAESTDLIGLFLLFQLKNLNAEIGLYRDDGLALTGSTPRQTEKLKQQIIKIFNDNGLKITIEANLKKVEFLDVQLDLENETFKPFIKPGDKPTYVNSKSNHPPCIIKNIPAAINKRLSTISGNTEIFNQAAPLYQNELDRNGYQYQLHFDPPNPDVKRKRRRRRRIIWFNPPWSMNVRTNIGAKFLKLVDKHFPLVTDCTPC